MKFLHSGKAVDAFQWTGDVAALVAFAKEVSLPKLDISLLDKTLEIQFPEGPMKAQKDDWIVVDNERTFSVCNPKLFPLAYEKVEKTSVMS